MAWWEPTSGDLAKATTWSLFFRAHLKAMTSCARSPTLVGLLPVLGGVRADVP